MIIKGIETNLNIPVNLMLKISSTGLINKITFASEDSTLLPTVKILKFVLPEKDNNNKPINGIGMLAFSSKKMCSINELIIPNSYTTIEPYSFKNSKISKVVWSNAVASIYHHCFANSTIESIENIDNLIEIEEFAFSDCHRLKQMKLPDNIMKIQEAAFQRTSLETISWPSNTRCIPKNCFSYSNIRTVENIDNIQMIGEGAFLGCQVLRQFDVPDTVTVVGSEAFANSHIEICKWSLNCNTIPVGCFLGSCLESITNAENCINIEEDAFGGCQSFTSICNIKNVANIGPGAFYGTALDTFNWPENCHIIPSMCFEYSELSTINIGPATEILNIDEKAFKGSKITELDLTYLIGYTNKDSSIKIKSPFYNLT